MLKDTSALAPFMERPAPPVFSQSILLRKVINELCVPKSTTRSATPVLPANAQLINSGEDSRVPVTKDTNAADVGLSFPVTIQFIITGEATALCAMQLTAPPWAVNAWFPDNLQLIIRGLAIPPLSA